MTLFIDLTNFFVSLIGYVFLALLLYWIVWYPLQNFATFNTKKKILSVLVLKNTIEKIFGTFEAES